MAKSSVVQLRRHKRPMPPADLLVSTSGEFRPAADLAAWAREVFIDEGGPLENPEHAHLQHAHIGFLWTNVGNARAGRRVLGQAELGAPGGTMGKWAKARAEMQVENWFGRIPDFVITIQSLHAAVCSDAEFCLLVDHEITHCGQAKDEFGQPKFSRSGRPVFALRGHDLEEFTSIARRYGAATDDLQAMKAALNATPILPVATIAQACGTCMARRAA